MHKSDAMLQELPSYMHVTMMTFFNRLRISVEKKGTAYFWCVVCHAFILGAFGVFRNSFDFEKFVQIRI